ncbi:MULTISPECIES: barstar family protein [unclassified Streptomyces]|uniref:barstar family protein n=1 Tax=unclassified Streptomyces TaxID=2593676 RepID=UPI0033B0AEF9
MTEIRGNRCRTTLDLFAEWAEALGFPDWFGHNWDAFEECLFTVTEAAAGPLTVLVRDADVLLVDEDPRQLATFLGIVDAVAQESGLALRTDQAA